MRRISLFLMVLFSFASISMANEALSSAELYSQGKRYYDIKDYKSAAPFMKEAAEMGNADAQMHLGKMYFNGWGVGHSHETAREWHEKAAKQGNKESIKKLKNFTH